MAKLLFERSEVHSSVVVSKVLITGQHPYSSHMAGIIPTNVDLHWSLPNTPPAARWVAHRGKEMSTNKTPQGGITVLLGYKAPILAGQVTTIVPQHRQPC